MTTARPMLDILPAGAELAWPQLAAGLGVAAVVIALVIRAARRVAGSLTRSSERGQWTGHRVLITVAILAAVGVAGIGGARSFGAVSAKFDSALVPLVADGMIVACSALRLAALTRGWRIPGALLTTYVFIAGTVWLNIDAATGIADAVAHALAPLAYAVLVEMLAHLLRLHMKLAQPAKPKLSALTWFTSPVITTRVWLHLARTGSADPVQARALVQQVVRMASRLNSICPSHRLWPLDSARAARTAALQTIRDGLLSARELAALLPAAGRLAPGELLALIDSAALGLTHPLPEDDVAPAAPIDLPMWLIGFIAGALHPTPAHSAPRTETTTPVHETGAVPGTAPARSPQRTGPTRKAAPKPGRDDRTDAVLLDELHRHSTAEHDGGPISQQEIRRVTGVGFPRAKRLAELAGWVEPPATPGAGEADTSDVAGQPDVVPPTAETPATNDHRTTDAQGIDTTERELEESNSR